MISDLIDLAVENLPQMTAIAVFVVGATKLILDWLRIKEAKIKIAQLEQQLEAKQTKIVSNLTPEEIEKYGKSLPNMFEVSNNNPKLFTFKRRFLVLIQ